MKKLNFKKLCKSMSFTEKANLIFADFNRHSDTRGKDRLLTPEEEEAIYEDCRKKNQIYGLNRLNGYFNLIRQAVVQVSIRIMYLDLRLSKASVIMMCMFYDQKVKEERLKNGADKDEKDYDFLGNFAPWFHSSDPKGADYDSALELEPNTDFQESVKTALHAYKLLREALYVVETMQARGEKVQFLNESQLKVIEGAKEKIEDFEAKNGTLAVLEVYRKAAECGLMKSSGFTIPEFEELLLHPEKALEFTEEDQAKSEEFIDFYLKNN